MPNIFRAFFPLNYTRGIAIVAILAIVIGIPIALVNLKGQQSIEQNAQIYTSGSYDTCKKIKLGFTENPICPRLNGQGSQKVSSYTWTATVTSNDGKPHTITYTQYSNFCTQPYAIGNPAQCVGNPMQQTFSNVSVPKTITIQRSPTVGANCGTYQDDLRITAIDGNTSCRYDGGGSGSVGASGLCETGITCQPTPTPKATNTPTPTPTSIPSVTITPSPGVTLSPTPSICVTPGAVTNVKISCPNCSTGQ